MPDTPDGDTLPAGPDGAAGRARGAGDDGAVDTTLRVLRRWKDTRTTRLIASLGLASRAIVYLALAVLVVGFAVTRRPRDTDQGSALADLAALGGGKVVIVALLVGVIAYSGWRWLDAITGPVDGDHSAGNRLLAFIEGAGYLPFGYFAVEILVGHPGKAEQGKQYRSLSARVLGNGWGVFAVVLVGVIVIIVGAVFCYQGVRQTFANHFDFPRHRPWVRPTVLGLGTSGSVARGLIFAMAGVLVIVGAARQDPRQVGGLDSALDTLARQSYGTVLLLAAAVGFAAFAVFAIAESIWRER